MRSWPYWPRPVNRPSDFNGDDKADRVWVTADSVWHQEDSVDPIWTSPDAEQSRVPGTYDGNPWPFTRHTESQPDMPLGLNSRLPTPVEMPPAVLASFVRSWFLTICDTSSRCPGFYR